MPAPRVLVTRPSHDAAPWVRQLAERGIAAEALPLIEIVPEPMGGALLRARQRGVEQPFITQAGRTAVLGQLLLVHRDQHGARQPAPCLVGSAHLASSRSTLRRLRMISRAASIASAKSAS